RNFAAKCATVFSGENIRQFTTVEPGEGIELPRPSELYQIEPDQDLRVGEYFVGLNVGGKTLFMVADTGSSNVIIDRKEFPEADPDKFLLQDFDVSYGSGRGLASKYADSVGLTCGATDVTYTVGILKQNFNLHNILGLGYPSKAFPPPPQEPIRPFFDQVYEKNQDSIMDLFAMALCGHKTGHIISLGGPLPEINQEDLTYVPIIHKSWYVIDARYMQVVDWVNNGGKWTRQEGATTKIGDFQRFSPDENGGAGSGIATHVDSGATHNYFPPEMYKNCLDVLRAASNELKLGIPDGFWNAKIGGPDYSIGIDHAVIDKLPKFQIIVRGPTDELLDLDLLPDTYLKELSPGKRTSSFRESTGYMNVLGQAFMEGYYVEFDRQSEPDRIGFASNKTFCVER
ncbi:hypothetical protein EHM76_05710, partial [bacterium]